MIESCLYVQTVELPVEVVARPASARSLANPGREFSSPINSEEMPVFIVAHVCRYPFLGRLTPTHLVVCSERKIDSLDSRLGTIEKMLHNLTVSLNNRGPPTASSSISPTLESAAAASSSAPRENSADALFGADKDNESDDFEATALMKEHTAFATQFIENTTFPFLDPEMRAAFLSLQELVKLQNIENARHDARFTTAKPLPKGGWAELPMPSADIVLSVLREIKRLSIRYPSPEGLVSTDSSTEHPPMGFPAIATFTGIEDFPDNVRRVYFATEEYSLMQWGIVNLGLYFTLQERGAASEGDRQVQLFEASFLCRDNIETALTNLPLLLPQRRESVELLIMAVCISSVLSCSRCGTDP